MRTPAAGNVEMLGSRIRDVESQWGLPAWAALTVVVLWQRCMTAAVAVYRMMYQCCSDVTADVMPRRDNTATATGHHDADSTIP